MKKGEESLKKMSYRKSEKIRDEYIERHKKRRTSGVITSAPDKVLLITVAFLVIIGFMAIFSASAPKCIEEGGHPAQFLLKQMLCFVVGFIGLKFFSTHDYKKLEDF